MIINFVAVLMTNTLPFYSKKEHKKRNCNCEL